MCFSVIALGLGTKNSNNEWLEVYYPVIINQPDGLLLENIFRIVETKRENITKDISYESFAIMLEQIKRYSDDSGVENLVRYISKSSNKNFVLVVLVEDNQLTSVPEAYLKLHLISGRFFKPNQLNLQNIFNILPNIAWTDKGAIDTKELEEKRLYWLSRGEKLNIKLVDKFPQMVDYIVPSKVRIGDASRIRLGAYLGEGTTVMHEGFINFNAGTEGPNMIEGRISAGVFVGKGSDLGGGCSTMGTLSGGNEIIISVGEQCLIGANAGLGIPLGDRCTIEAGLYLTAGSKVAVIPADKKQVKVVKASELSKQSDLLFRRNSQNGCIECLVTKSTIQLNKILHDN